MVTKKLTSKKIETIIKKWMKENHIPTDEVRFYTPKEWRTRGEKYCNNAELVITAEDELCEQLTGDYDWHIANSLSDLLGEHGLRYDMGYSWMIGIYED